MRSFCDCGKSKDFQQDASAIRQERLISGIDTDIKEVKLDLFRWHHVYKKSLEIYKKIKIKAIRTDKWVEQGHKIQGQSKKSNGH